MSTRAWWREPFVHFLAFGVLTHGIGAAWTASSGPVPPSVTRDEVVVVDEVVLAELTRQFQATFAKDPGPGDLDGAVEAWVREEILVREAVALGLDRGDARVRGRLAEKMAFVAGAREVPDAPTDADLRALYEVRRDELVLETRLTLRQLFAPDEASARGLLQRWNQGEDPRDLGRDRPTAPGGPVLRARSHEVLARSHGDRFADAVLEMEVGERAMVRSSLGWHAVEVLSRREGGPLSFEDARDRLALWWRTAAHARAEEAAIDALSERYEVQGWPR